MRHLTLALAAVLSLAGCTEEEQTDTDRDEWTAAVGLQNQGRFEEAAARYRALVRSTKNEGLAAKAELEIGRIEVALAGRDRALQRLAKLPAQLDVRQLPAVLSAIDVIVLEFEGTMFADEIADRAHAARLAARTRHEEQRSVERGAVDELLTRGEFTAALDLLRRIESKRTVHDRRDVAEMLAATRTSSEAAADAALAEFKLRAERDEGEAVAWIDRQMVPFRGTRAYARLLAARLAAQPLPAKGEGGAAEGSGDAAADEG